MDTEGTMDAINRYLGLAKDAIVLHGTSLVLGLIVLWVGMKVLNKVLDKLDDFMLKRGIDNDLRPFIHSLLSAILKMLLILMVAGMVGIPITSFVAILAAVSFAIGMALQGSLSNFASGIMILIFKPYRQGDLIDVDGKIGHVKEIQIFNTIIIGLDNKMVIIPNSLVMSGVITNLSAEGHLRVELSVNMPYSEDFAHVEGIILEAMKNTPKVIQDPAPLVGIHSYDSHYIILAVWPYALTEDYWDVYFNVNRNVKKALSENGIQVAYTEGMELGPIGK